MGDQTNGGALVPMRGSVERQEFGATEQQMNAETAIAAVTARERALVEAHYLMAERHPRNWMDVRTAMLQHCARWGFSDIARYAKPVGKKLINGEWEEQYARGFTVRFAETLAQEMGNVKPEAAITYEDALIRIVRFSVTDLQRNLPRSREVSVAKTVERRGKKTKDGWKPPDGREVISERLNSYGEPTYLVKATDDEIRNKINAEESKCQRDFTLKLCPRDILDECELKIAEVLTAEQKRDPEAALKRLLDRFAAIGIRPSDLETFIGKPTRQWGPVEDKLLRELGVAIKEGQTTFDEALRARYDTPAEGEKETPAQHDARLQRQMEQQRPPETQADVAERKIAELSGKPLKRITEEDIQAAIAAKTSTHAQGGDAPGRALPAQPSEPTEEEMQAITNAAARREGQLPEKPSFARRR